MISDFLLRCYIGVVNFFKLNGRIAIRLSLHQRSCTGWVVNAMASRKFAHIHLRFTSCNSRLLNKSFERTREWHNKRWV